MNLNLKSRSSYILFTILAAALVVSCVSSPIENAGTFDASIKAGWKDVADSAFAKAKTEFSDAIAAGAGAEAFRGRALAHFALGDLAKCAQDFLASIRLEPEHPYSAAARDFVTESLPIDGAALPKIAEMDALLQRKGMPVWSRRTGLVHALHTAGYARQDQDETADILQEGGYIRNWLVLGSFPNPSGAGIDVPFIDEEKTSAPHDGLEEVPCKGEKGESWFDAGGTGLSPLFIPSGYTGTDSYAVHYSSAVIDSPETADYWIILEWNNASLRMWVDGELLAYDAGFGGIHKSVWIRVRLAKGEHRILVKTGSSVKVASFSVSVEKATLPALDSLATQQYLRMIDPAIMPDSNPLLGRLAAVNSVQPSFESAFWLSYALSLTGKYAGARLVAEALPAEGEGDPAFRSWLESFAEKCAGRPADAQLALRRFPAGRGFAPRDDDGIREAIGDHTLNAANALSTESGILLGRRYKTDLYAALIDMLSRENGSEIYKNFKESHPLCPELALAAYERGGLGIPRASLLADMSVGDLRRFARLETFRALARDGQFQAASALGNALREFNRGDVEFLSFLLYANFRSGSLTFDAYIGALETAARQYPGRSNFMNDMLEMCNSYIKNVEAAIAGNSSAQKPADLEQKKSKLLDAARRMLAFDPSNFNLRHMVWSLEGNGFPSGVFYDFEPAKLIAKFEASGMKPKGDAVLIEDREVRVFFEDGAVRIQRSYIVKILSRSAIEGEATQYLQRTMNEEYGNIRCAYMLKQGGKRVDALVSGSRMNFKGLDVGDYVIVDYVSNGMRYGQFRKDFWLDAPLELYYDIFSRTLKVIYPKGSDPVVSIHGGERVKPIVEKKDLWEGYEQTSFSTGFLGAAKYEIPAGSWRDALCWVDISTVDSWSEVARWYADLAYGSTRVTPGVAEKAKSLVRDARNRTEAIAKIFEYCSAGIVYEDLAFMYSAFVPQSADSIMQDASGDCKDKSALLIALLAAVGIEAEYALSEPSYRGENNYLPSTRFSHVIVLVKDGSTVIPLDATGSVFTFPEMPLSLVGTMVLPIPRQAPESEERLVRLAAPVARESAWISQVTVGLDSVAMEGRAVLRGDGAANVRNMLSMENADLKTRLAFSYLASTYNGFEPARVDWENVNSLASSPTLKFSGTLRGAVEASTNSYSVSIPFASPIRSGTLAELRGSPPDSPRTTPLGLWLPEFADGVKETVVINVSREYMPRSIPPALELSFGAAKASFSYWAFADGLVIQSYIKIPPQNIAPERLAEFIAFIEKIAAAQARELVFSK